jgi:hypothetical protein
MGSFQRVCSYHQIIYPYGHDNQTGMVSSASTLYRQTILTIIRLLEYAPSYYNVKEFPDGETKSALIRILNKKLGRRLTTNAEDQRPKKKKKAVGNGTNSKAYIQGKKKKRDGNGKNSELDITQGMAGMGI